MHQKPVQADAFMLLWFLQQEYYPRFRCDMQGMYDETCNSKTKQ